MIKRIIRKIKAGLHIGSKPDFLIIGAQKAGTTSLFNYLVKYGDNFISPIRKELYYFTENDFRSINSYHANFPIFKGTKVTGEATPDYLFYHKTPKTVHAYNPNLKIVIMLRNPTERAYSQYTHQNYTDKTKACDPLSFSDAIRKEESRYHIDENTKFYHEYKYYSYKKRGIYIEQINNWLKYFNRDQVHIIFLEELEDDFENQILLLMEFLGIKKNSRQFENKVYNQGPKSKINSSDKQYLDDFFKPYNKDLFELLNRRNIWL